MEAHEDVVGYESVLANVAMSLNSVYPTVGRPAQPSERLRICQTSTITIPVDLQWSD